MDLKSEKYLFPQSINDRPLYNGNSHRDLCILHGKTTEIKVKTVIISEHIKLLIMKIIKVGGLRSQVI